MATLATEPRPPQAQDREPGYVGPGSPALSTHGACAIGEFLVVEESRASLPRGAEWADVIHPWYRFDFEDAECELDKGRLVALPCGAEDRAAVEVALTSEIQLAVQTHYDAQRGLLWVRKARRGGAAPGETEHQG